MAARRLRTGPLLRAHLEEDARMVGRPPRRLLALGRRLRDGLRPGTGRGAGRGTAPAGDRTGSWPCPRHDRGRLAAPERPPGPGPDPAALRPGPPGRPDPRRPRRRLSVGRISDLPGRGGAAILPRFPA